MMFVQAETEKRGKELIKKREDHYSKLKIQVRSISSRMLIDGRISSSDALQSNLACTSVQGGGRGTG
jgi:hypothetical protein